MEYQVAETFHSIQTEGPLAGMPAFFIRLAGCNLECEFCDTDHSALATYTQNELVNAVVASRATVVIITGGEPFLQDISSLVEELTEGGYIVQIETNGTVAPQSPDEWLYQCEIVCSPKGKINPLLKPYITAYKVLVDNSTTPEDISSLNLCGCELFLQPQMTSDVDQQNRNILHAVELCKLFDVKLSLQYHKFINIP